MLVVSRPDINCEEITDFDVKDRFIKLPVIPYLKLLPSPVQYSRSVFDDINRPQIALLNAANSKKYRFICAALSRRLGKTFISNIIGQLVTLMPYSNVLIVSPTYNLSSISFDLQRNFIKHFQIEVSRNNVKDRIIELENGSTIRMGSISTIDNCVGRSYDLIIFDEAALSPDGEDAFNVALRPTLDKPNSKAIFISTPRGKNNWFSLFFDRGFSDIYPEWISIHADYLENKRSSESDINEARRSMSRNQFEQEYMANFNIYDGLIYEVNREIHVVDFLPDDNEEVYYLAGLDPGFKDPTAFSVIAYRPTYDCYHIVDEYLENERTTSSHAKSIIAFMDEYSIEDIFIDPAAAQFAADLAFMYDIPTCKAKKDVNPGIAYIQSLLESNRLFISPKCEKTIAAFDQYKWDNNTALIREKPSHTNSHLPDAVRYAIYTYVV